MKSKKLPPDKAKSEKTQVSAGDEFLGTTEEDLKLRRIADAAHQLGIRSLEQARAELEKDGSF